MSEQKDKDEDFSEDALAALVGRPSAAAQSPERKDEATDAVVDLRALAASIPAAAAIPAEAKELLSRPERADVESSSRAEKARADSSATKAGVAKAAIASPGAAAAGASGAAAAKSSSNLVIGLVVGAAVAAGVVWFLRGDGNSGEDAVGAEVVQEAPAAVEPGVATAEPVPAEPTALVPQPAPAVEPASGTSPAAAGTAAPAEDSNPPRPLAADNARRAEAPPVERQAAAPAASPVVASAPAAAPVVAATPAAVPSAPAAGNPLDSMLDRALGGRPAAGGTKTVVASTPAPSRTVPDDPNLPEVPDRAAVSRSLGRMVPGIRQCAGAEVGLATATILIKNDGSVATVSIGGSPFGGTAAGTCMEGVVKRAEFPRFRQTTFRVTYPFSIRPAEP